MTPAGARAILIERHGPPEVLAERDISVPRPAAGQLLVRTRAAGVNFADLIMRQGLYATVPPLPYAPGFEIAGEVEEVGPGVTGWKPGDRIVALARYGGYATRVMVDAGRAFPCPPTMSFAEAAAMPVVFLTAWVCLFEAARARAGETVLVLGAAGGVGTAAVQLGVGHGLRVIGTAGGPAKTDFVRRIGALDCADSTGDWAAAVESTAGPRGIDVALDPVGGSATAACRNLLAPLGRLVFYGLSEAIGPRRNWLRVAAAWLRTPRLHPYALVEPNIGVHGVHLLHLHGKEATLVAAMRQILDGVAAGRWRPIVDRTFPLTASGAAAAHRHLHERRNMGKVLLVTEENA